MAKVRELKEKDALIEDQASEIGKLRVNLAETKVVKSTDSSNQTVTDFLGTFGDHGKESSC